MAKRKSNTTPSPSQKGKKAKTSSRPKIYDEKNYQVRVILPSSPKSLEKTPKTPSTSAADKGKKVGKTVGSASAIIKKQKVRDTSTIPTTPTAEQGIVSVDRLDSAKKKAAEIFGASSPKNGKDRSQRKSSLAKEDLVFWPEKAILVKELEDKRFSSYLWSWGMKKLVEQPRRVNATLVEEFYNEAPAELDTPFGIRSCQVDVSPDSINSYYGLMDTEHQGDRGMDASELTEDDLRSLRRFQHPTHGSENDVMASELDIHTAICLTWLRENVMPRNKASRFTADEKKFLREYHRGNFIHLGQLIFSELQKRVNSLKKEKSRQRTLYFPSLITGLLEKQGVKSRKKDVWLADSKPHTGELELRIWESRGGKDTTCTEAIERVRELKALREAKKSSSRKNKFSSPAMIKGPVQEPIPAPTQTIRRDERAVNEISEELEAKISVLVERKVEEKIAEFFNSISDPQDFVRRWEQHREEQNVSPVGFARFAKGISIQEPAVPKRNEADRQPIQFEQEELMDSQPELAVDERRELDKGKGKLVELEKMVMDSDSSDCEEIDTAVLEEQRLMLESFAEAAGQPPFIQERGEGSGLIQPVENESSPEAAQLESHDQLILTCQVPQHFGPVKCTSLLDQFTSLDFIPRLNIIHPDIQRLINQARMGQLRDEEEAQVHATEAVPTLALVPFKQPQPINQVPLVEEEVQHPQEQIRVFRGEDVATMLVQFFLMYNRMPSYEFFRDLDDFSSTSSSEDESAPLKERVSPKVMAHGTVKKNVEDVSVDPRIKIVELQEKPVEKKKYKGVLKIRASTERFKPNRALTIHPVSEDEEDETPEEVVRPKNMPWFCREDSEPEVFDSDASSVSSGNLITDEEELARELARRDSSRWSRRSQRLQMFAPISIEDDSSEDENSVPDNSPSTVELSLQAFPIELNSIVIWDRTFNRSENVAAAILVQNSLVSEFFLRIRQFINRTSIPVIPPSLKRKRKCLASEPEEEEYADEYQLQHAPTKAGKKKTNLKTGAQKKKKPMQQPSSIPPSPVEADREIRRMVTRQLNLRPPVSRQQPKRRRLAPKSPQQSKHQDPSLDDF